MSELCHDRSWLSGILPHNAVVDWKEKTARLEEGWRGRAIVHLPNEVCEYPRARLSHVRAAGRPKPGRDVPRQAMIPSLFHPAEQNLYSIGNARVKSHDS